VSRGAGTGVGTGQIVSGAVGHGKLKPIEESDGAREVTDGTQTMGSLRAVLTELQFTVPTDLGPILTVIAAVIGADEGTK